MYRVAAAFEAAYVAANGRTRPGSGPGTGGGPMTDRAR